MIAKIGRYLKNGIYYFVVMPVMAFSSLFMLLLWISRLEKTQSNVVWSKEMLGVVLLNTLYFWGVTALLVYWGIIKKKGVTDVELGWALLFLCGAILLSLIFILIVAREMGVGFTT
jgi:hypothetical protein